MLLKDKIAIVYGGGGAIGGETARSFAREGAQVVLAGRTLSKLEAVAADIAKAGGQAEIAQLDLLNEHAVLAHADAVAKQHGRIDIAFNAFGVMHVQGAPLLDLSYEDFAHPIIAYTRANFLTAKAVARHMVKQTSGVILLISTPGSVFAVPGVLGFGAACAATESMTRHLAAELGPSGVRVVCLRPDAIPEAMRRGSHSKALFDLVASGAGASADELLQGRADAAALLKRTPRLEEVADTAAFVASDRAGAMTAAIVNLTCGTVAD